MVQGSKGFINWSLVTGGGPLCFLHLIFLLSRTTPNKE
jgi:hypothetical protein